MSEGPQVSAVPDDGGARRRVNVAVVGANEPASKRL